MSLPFTHFEFTRTMQRMDKREKFIVFNIHLLSGSSKNGCQFTIDLEDGGRTLLLKSHICGGGIAERFLNSDIFKKAFTNKVRDRSYNGIFSEKDVDEIAISFDHHVRNETDQFNSFHEWTMKFPIPTEYAGRDIVERFPIYKMVKSAEPGIGKDVIHSLCTIVRLDWEDKESANLKTPTRGVVIDMTSDEEEDDDEYSIENMRQKRLKMIDSNNGNSSTCQYHVSICVWLIVLLMFLL